LCIIEKRKKEKGREERKRERKINIKGNKELKKKCSSNQEALQKK
jgi:hypothetical protein